MEVFNTCLLVACLIVGVVLIYFAIIQYELSQPIYEIRETENSVGDKRFFIHHIKSNENVCVFETLEQANEYFNENCKL